MSSFAEFSKIRTILAQTAAHASRAVEQFYAGKSSAPRVLGEELAWVAAVHVEEVTAQAGWEADPDAAFFLTLAVHEIIEWVARMQQIEKTGRFSGHDTLSWCPSGGYEYGSREYGRIVDERWNLLLDELGVPKQKEVA